MSFPTEAEKGNGTFNITAAPSKTEKRNGKRMKEDERTHSYPVSHQQLKKTWHLGSHFAKDPNIKI